VGGWKDLLESTQSLSNPPLLIVTSRHADERLWAEALNFGAYDVIAKPFYPIEVIRIVSLACLRWRQRATTASSVNGDREGGKRLRFECYGSQSLPMNSSDDLQ
jgi:DNA-binding response OmpR family regulator